MPRGGKADEEEAMYMGILELIIGIIIFLFLVNLILAFIPIPRGIGGAIVIVLVIFLVLRLMGMV